MDLFTVITSAINQHHRQYRTRNVNSKSERSLQHLVILKFDGAYSRRSLQELNKIKTFKILRMR